MIKKVLETKLDADRGPMHPRGPREAKLRKIAECMAMLQERMIVLQAQKPRMVWLGWHTAVRPASAWTHNCPCVIPAVAIKTIFRLVF